MSESTTLNRALSARISGSEHPPKTFVCGQTVSAAKNIPCFSKLMGVVSPCSSSYKQVRKSFTVPIERFFCPALTTGPLNGRAAPKGKTPQYPYRHWHVNSDFEFNLGIGARRRVEDISMKELEKLRDWSGLSLLQLSNLTGLTPAKLSNAENCVVRLKDGEIAIVRKALLKVIAKRAVEINAALRQNEEPVEIAS